jgi:adenylate cyclase
MNRVTIIRILITLTVFALGAALVTGAAVMPGVKMLQQKALDIRYQIRGPGQASGQVVVAAIDGASIRAFGRWPWPRSIFAALVSRLEEEGAKTIVFDLLFSEPEENPVQSAVQGLMQSYVELELLGDDMRSQIFMDEMQDAIEAGQNDRFFAETLAQSGKAILALALEDGTPYRDEFLPFMAKGAYGEFANEKLLSQGQLLTLPRALLPLPEIGAAAAGLGYVNVYPDRDGVIRLVKLAIAHKGALFMPMAMAAARHYLDVEPVYDGAGSITISARKLSINARGEAYLDFYAGNAAFAVFSCADIIDGKIPAGALQGKVVVIGGTTTGLGDIWATPLAQGLWGVFLQANLIDNILQNNMLRTPSDPVRASLWSMFVLTALSFGGACLLAPLWAPVAGAIVLGSYLAAGQYLFAVHGLIWPMAMPVATSFVSGLALLSVNYIIEGQKRRWIKQSFDQYLSPEVVNTLVKNPSSLVLGGELQDLTVLFADIRGFTTLAEGMDPQELTRFLNEILGLLTQAIIEHGGTLDKYMGDAVMAFFGAPVHSPDHRQMACRSAVAMTEMLHEARQEWQARGWPMVRIGVGLNSGDMVVGNLGSERRFDYSVIGNEVNLGSRLEGLTKVYGVKIIIGENTRCRLARETVCRELDLVKVKGQKEPVRIYELLGKDYFSGGGYAFLESFSKGLQLYRNGEYGAAITAFAATMQLKTQDRPSQYFINRCQQLLAHPPASDWDGVWIHTAK